MLARIKNTTKYWETRYKCIIDGEEYYTLRINNCVSGYFASALEFKQ